MAMSPDLPASTSIRCKGRLWTRGAQGKALGLSGLPIVILFCCGRRMSPYSPDDGDLWDLGRLSAMTSWSKRCWWRTSKRWGSASWMRGMNPDWTVGPVWVMRRAGIEGASTIPNGCISCDLMPKDDFRGASSEHEMVSCIVIVQNGGDEETCVVKQATASRWLRTSLWPTTCAMKIQTFTRLETSVGCMWACKVAPWITLQVSGKNKLVGTETSIRRSLGPTFSPTLWLKNWLFRLRQGLGRRARLLSWWWRAIKEDNVPFFNRDQEFRQVGRQTLWTTSHEIQTGTAMLGSEVMKANAGVKSRQHPEQHSFFFGDRRRQSWVAHPSQVHEQGLGMERMARTALGQEPDCRATGHPLRVKYCQDIQRAWWRQLRVWRE